MCAKGGWWEERPGVKYPPVGPPADSPRKYTTATAAAAATAVRSPLPEFSSSTRSHAGRNHLWTVAALRLPVGMFRLQPGPGQCGAERRRARQPVRLLHGHAPAAAARGQGDVRAGGENSLYIRYAPV